MKNQIFDASIHWLPREEGGRIAPPIAGAKYCPIIKFDAISTDSDWSAQLIRTDISSDCDIIKIGFLSNDAPNFHIQCGDTFSLYEGQRKVAYGIIL